jgi:murein DD-endopeptidase MepM/ murein hydrolase activator NlpD
MEYKRSMNFTIRKSIKRQEELPESFREGRVSSHQLSSVSILPLTIVFCLISSFSGADIYRFVTTDGVETFTDAPSNKTATVVIKEQPTAALKQRKSSKKPKTHDVSLDEIVLKTVSASINAQDHDPIGFKAHLPPVGGTITSKVGMRIDPIDGKWRQHNGIDIAIPSGTPVRPVARGVVVYSGSRTGYGNTIIVEHDNGVVTLYAHNSQLLASEGQVVTSDSTIAVSGSTGRSTGPHLHFEAWQTGTNVTEAFLPNSGITLSDSTLVASSRRTARFRSETLSDGSILFTNIPSSTP